MPLLSEWQPRPANKGADLNEYVSPILSFYYDPEYRAECTHELLWKRQWMGSYVTRTPNEYTFCNNLRCCCGVREVAAGQLENIFNVLSKLYEPAFLISEAKAFLSSDPYDERCAAFLATTVQDEGGEVLRLMGFQPQVLGVNGNSNNVITLWLWTTDIKESFPDDDDDDYDND